MRRNFLQQWAPLHQERWLCFSFPSHIHQNRTLDRNLLFEKQKDHYWCVGCFICLAIMILHLLQENQCFASISQQCNHILLQQWTREVEPLKCPISKNLWEIPFTNHGVRFQSMIIESESAQSLNKYFHQKSRISKLKWKVLTLKCLFEITTLTASEATYGTGFA